MKTQSFLFLLSVIINFADLRRRRSNSLGRPGLPGFAPAEAAPDERCRPGGRMPCPRVAGLGSEAEQMAATRQAKTRRCEFVPS